MTAVVLALLAWALLVAFVGVLLGRSLARKDRRDEAKRARRRFTVRFLIGASEATAAPRRPHRPDSPRDTAPSSLR